MEPRQAVPWIRCSSCSYLMPIEERFFEGYFEGQKVSCRQCGHGSDFWEMAALEAKENWMSNQVFGLVFARHTIFKIILRPNEVAQYKLIDYGLPPNAEVLYVNYSPNGGGLFPLEMHGNVATERRPRQHVYLWPRPLSREKTPEATEVNCFVTWVPMSTYGHAWRNLVKALDMYSSGEYLSAIVPANVAVESSLTPMLAEYLPQHIGSKKSKEFLKDGASYSHQLNAVLPLITSLLNIPKLPDHIRGKLNELRDHRNQVAHHGVLKDDLTQEQVSALICAAVFGFQYMRYVNARLSGAT